MLLDSCPLLVEYAVKAFVDHHCDADVAVLLCAVALVSGANYWLHMLTAQGVASSHICQLLAVVFVLLYVCVFADMVDHDLYVDTLPLFCYMPIMHCQHMSAG